MDGAAEGLKHLIQARMAELQKSFECREQVIAPRIYRHEPDASGCT
jgi:hypothetical protein